MSYNNDALIKLDSDLTRLYEYIDTYNESNIPLLNLTGEQTDFGRLLRDVLISLTDNCDNYITYLFDNKPTYISFLTCKNSSISTYYNNVANKANKFPDVVNTTDKKKEYQKMLLLQLLITNANTGNLKSKIKSNTISQKLLNIPQSGGGNAKITKKSKKSILGKDRCIYKKAGDRKEYLRYKGDLITVKDYTKLMKSKAAKAAKA